MKGAARKQVSAISYTSLPLLLFTTMWCVYEFQQEKYVRCFVSVKESFLLLLVFYCWKFRLRNSNSTENFIWSKTNISTMSLNGEKGNLFLLLVTSGKCILLWFQLIQWLLRNILMSLQTASQHIWRCSTIVPIPEIIAEYKENKYPCIKHRFNKKNIMKNVMWNDEIY